jgi:hypothetical protein
MHPGAEPGIEYRGGEEKKTAQEVSHKYISGLKLILVD